MTKLVLVQFGEMLNDSASRDESLWLAPKDVKRLLKEVISVQKQLATNLELARMQRHSLVRANRAFIKAHGWPDYQYPDLSTLIEWLLDHSGKTQAELLQTAVEDILQSLMDLGTLAWDDNVTLSGKWIIPMRCKLTNILLQVQNRNSS